MSQVRPSQYWARLPQDEQRRLTTYLPEDLAEKYMPSSSGNEGLLYEWQVCCAYYGVLGRLVVGCLLIEDDGIATWRGCLLFVVLYLLRRMHSIQEHAYIITRNSPYPFTCFYNAPTQAQCLVMPGVLTGRNLVYTAPTGGGKTLVAEVLLMRRMLERLQRGCTSVAGMIVLPYNAVCREKVCACVW